MSRDITSLPPVEADERVRYGEHSSQFFDVFRAQGKPRGVAVMIHGGFWRARYDLTHASHLCAALAREGISVANLEYRRVGEQGGGWPGTFEDVRLGVDEAVALLGASPVVMGHSAGGHLALRLASETLTIKGVVALAPVADLQLAYELNLSNGAVQEFLGEDPAEEPILVHRACASRHGSFVRRILVHGTADDIVPLQLSRNFISRREADAGSVELVEVAGADHFDLIDPESSAWPVVRECVLRLL